MITTSIRLGSTGYQPVLAGNLPDSASAPDEPVGKLPTWTGKLPVLPILNEFGPSTALPNHYLQNLQTAYDNTRR